MWGWDVEIVNVKLMSKPRESFLWACPTTYLVTQSRHTLHNRYQNKDLIILFFEKALRKWLDEVMFEYNEETGSKPKRSVNAPGNHN